MARNHYILSGLISLTCLFLYFTPAPASDSPSFSLATAISTLDSQTLTLNDLRTSIETHSKTNEATHDVVTKWIEALHERDVLIVALQTAAVDEETEMARIVAAGHSIGLSTMKSSGVASSDVAGSDVASLSAPVQGAVAAMFDKESCPISWSAYIPSGADEYFFGQGPKVPSSCVTHGELLAVRCYVNDFTVDRGRIDVAYGGEAIEGVMGQVEDVEYAKYTRGAFGSAERGLLPTEHLSHGWYINKVLKGMVEREPDVATVCDETPTLFITRYEYVNLFHTVTDWWNIYEAVPQSFWLAHSKVNIVWLDGHAAGNLDSTWQVAFGDSLPVKHLPGEVSCFKKAVIVSAGYASPLWKNNRSWKSPMCSPAADAFANHMLARFGLQATKRVPKRVVLIDRVPYTAHPRSSPGKMPRTIDNIEVLEAAVKEAGGEVKVVRFEELGFGEQLREVREADVLVGIHGAGLSHVLFMSPGATMVELATNQLGMFNGFATWRPAVKFVSVHMGSGSGNYHLSADHVKQVLTLF